MTTLRRSNWTVQLDGVSINVTFFLYIMLRNIQKVSRLEDWGTKEAQQHLTVLNFKLNFFLGGGGCLVLIPAKKAYSKQNITVCLPHFPFYLVLQLWFYLSGWVPAPLKTLAGNWCCFQWGWNRATIEVLNIGRTKSQGKGKRDVVWCLFQSVHCNTRMSCCELNIILPLADNLHKDSSRLAGGLGIQLGRESRQDCRELPVKSVQ